MQEKLENGKWNAILECQTTSSIKSALYFRISHSIFKENIFDYTPFWEKFVCEKILVKWVLLRGIATRIMKEFRNHMKKFWPEKLKHNQEVAICPLWTSSTIAFHIWYVSSFQVRIFSEKQTAVEFLKNSE